MSETMYAVFIGRFQPFHSAHHAILQHALKKFDRVLVCVGSAYQARSPKNPFTVAERKTLILSTLTTEQIGRVHFLPIRDYFYNESLWLTDIQRQVGQIVSGEPGPVHICGRIKDRSSYYIRLFPQWKIVEYDEHHDFDATLIRQALVEKDLETIGRHTPEPVRGWLESWMHSEAGEWIREEARFYEAYKGRYSQAPFPPVHVTADSVVIQAGHVLLVRRRSSPGKGLLALPGGFISQDEAIEESALRELKEETGLMVPKKTLRSRIMERHTFDHPDRSLRGRVVTTAHCIRLEPAIDFDLPQVKGDDDAEKAFWMPVDEIHLASELFFEDHWHIIKYFTSRG